MDQVHTGNVTIEMGTQLQEIANLFQRLYPEELKKDKTFHVSVDSVADKRLLELVEQIRMQPIFKRIFCTDRFKSCRVENLTEMDELYYSYPNYTGSDANMFISHYDGPYTKKLTDYVRIYRFLIAITPNTTVTTHFPHKNNAITLDFGDYVGWDYNNELHFVSGMAEQGKPRMLLKIHFAICNPCQNKTFLQKVKGWHAWYLHTLRNEHNESKDVERIEHKRHAFILNAGRYVYTHMYWFLAMLFISLLLLSWYVSFPQEFLRVIKTVHVIPAFLAFTLPILIGIIMIPYYYPLIVKIRLLLLISLISCLLAYTLQCILVGKCYAWYTLLCSVLIVLPLMILLIVYASPYFMPKATFHY
jgi:hypothetical protein